MARQRPVKPGTPLNLKQDELAQKEAKLRAEIEKVERMIADAPKRAEETSRRHREELSVRAKEGKSRLDVTMDLQRSRWPSDGSSGHRRVSLRKERREGRLLFLVLVIALGATVIWLATHFHF
jgi:hypothetical protein